MKITAVGGYKAVGRNMTGVCVGGETVALDNGIRLDTLQMYDKEIDMLPSKTPEDLMSMDVIPDQALLGDVSAQLLSHGHLDHIGALPITRPENRIISTEYTVEMARREFKEGDFYGVDYCTEYEIAPGLSAEFVEATHSIPHSSFIVLHTPEGDVVYASDFRFDNHSLIGRTNYKRLREIGRGNVKALIVESTRVGVEGKTPSESVVREKLADVMEFIDSGLIIATTFSTHVERIQAILDAAEKANRTPLIIGRSLVKNIELGRRFGLLDLPLDAKLLSTPKAIKAALMSIDKRDDYFLLSTGHQGEADSVLSKIVDGRYPLKLEKGDSVLFCAATIPSPINQASRYVLESKLKAFGARIYSDIHVSGHASKEDHRLLLDMLKPEKIIPCHGDMGMRSSYALLAAEEGYVLGGDVHLMMNGDSIEI